MRKTALYMLMIAAICLVATSANTKTLHLLGVDQMARAERPSLVCSTASALRKVLSDSNRIERDEIFAARECWDEYIRGFPGDIVGEPFDCPYGHLEIREVVLMGRGPYNVRSGNDAVVAYIYYRTKPRSPKHEGAGK